MKQFVKNILRQSKVLSNFAKESVNNPGKGLRKLTAGYVKDPVVGTVGIASSAIPVPGAQPASLALTPAISAGSKQLTPKPIRKKLRETSKEILSNDGRTKASKIGQKIEYHTNKSLMNLSEIAKYFN